jgi:hypothetical protein
MQFLWNSIISGEIINLSYGEFSSFNGITHDSDQNFILRGHNLCYYGKFWKYQEDYFNILFQISSYFRGDHLWYFNFFLFRGDRSDSSDVIIFEHNLDSADDLISVS